MAFTQRPLCTSQEKITGRSAEFIEKVEQSWKWPQQAGTDDAFSDPEECDERVACRVAAYCDSLVGMDKSARSKIMAAEASCRVGRN